MEVKDLARVMCQRARLRGFRCQRGYAWKVGHELVWTIKVHGSPWGKAKGVGYGPSVRAMVETAGVPRYRGGFLMYAEESDSLVRHPAFDRAACDHEGIMQAEELVEALDQLIAWVDTQLGDEEWVREQVLTARSPIQIRSLPDLRDWAQGQLKSPSHYYPQS